jgi:pre-mRNA-processing factor 8
MSERVQLLLSDRILGMTLVPEGRVWNYGIGLTQLWSPNIPYSITLDTPLLFWAEEHRPAAFLTVSYFFALLSLAMHASDTSLTPVRKS